MELWSFSRLQCAVIFVVALPISVSAQTLGPVDAPIPGLAPAESTLDYSQYALGETAYNGDWSAEDIIVHEMTKALAANPNARLQFKIEIPTVKDGQNLVDPSTGLTVEGQPGDARQNIKITIPFDSKDFVSEGVFDSAAFDAHVQDTLFSFSAPFKDNRVTDKGFGDLVIESTPPAVNMPNCGGYPVGTEITYTDCAFERTVTCMTGGPDGTNHWVTTSLVIIQREEDWICN